MNDPKVRVTSRKMVFDGFNRLEILEYECSLHNGGWSGTLEREVLTHHNGVAVLPYDPVQDSVLLLEQFRPGAHLSGQPAWQLEPVSGMIEEGQSVSDAARTELREEAGCEIVEMEPITGYLVSPGYTTEHVSCFCGRIDATGREGIFGNRDEGEDIKVHVLSLHDAENMLRSGEIGYALTIICIQWLLLNRECLQEKWR
jgi:ADP-ribose pyrophosphatase